MTTKKWTHIDVNKSADGSAATYTFSLENGELVEGSVDNGSELFTTTISSQLGCRVACNFCSAGLRFVRSLTPEEIVSQADRMIADFDAAKRPLLITFMGIGEPLLNLKNLVVALQELHRKYPQARLYVSTSAPKVNYEPLFVLAARIRQIDLQVSVHEPNDERRGKLIPFRAKMLLGEIAELGKQWYERTKRSPVMNYCVNATNSSAQDASELARIFDPTIWVAKVSVINASLSEAAADAYDRGRQLAERFLLHLQSLGFHGLLFDQLGQRRVAGACGQFQQFRDWVRATAPS